MKMNNELVNEYINSYFNNNNNCLNQGNKLKNGFFSNSNPELNSFNKKKNTIKQENKSKDYYNLYDNVNQHNTHIKLEINSLVEKSLRFLNSKNNFEKNKTKKYIKKTKNIINKSNSNKINIPLNQIEYDDYNNIENEDNNYNNMKINNENIEYLQNNIGNDNILKFKNSQIELNENLFIPAQKTERENEMPKRKIYNITSILPNNNIISSQKIKYSNEKEDLNSLNNNHNINNNNNNVNQNNFRLKDLQSMFNYINNLNSNIY